VIVQLVERSTMPVDTVKVALVAPAGMVTVPGTEHAALLSESVTTAPPAGAGPFRVTVPVEACRPPMTLVGFRVSEVKTAGSTLSEALRVTPPADAETVTAVALATALVPMLKLALVVPAATVTEEGTEAAPLLSERATCTPPAGAGPSSVTVPVAPAPPVTLAGLTLNAETLGGSTVSVTLCVRPPYEAEMLAEVDTDTPVVVTVKVALTAPAEIKTEAGTKAAPLLLDRATCAPPAGAGPSIVTVPVTVAPPRTLPWLRLSAATLGGTTVSDAVCVAPP
jgi:hypothetical protein